MTSDAATSMISPRVVMLGASGAVGARSLHHLLDDARAERVTAIGRRPLLVQHKRLQSVVTDFKHASSGLGVPDEVDVAICCLGTTMKVAGSKAAFFAIDHDTVVHFAQSAYARGARRFILVSSSGAKATSSNFYLQTKGMTEADVADVEFVDVHILRPSVLDDEGSRATARAAERAGIAVMSVVAAVIGKTHKWAPISVDTVGKAIAHLATAPLGERQRIIHESDAIQRLGASSPHHHHRRPGDHQQQRDGNHGASK